MKNATTCTYCNKCFTKKNYKVAHHDHVTGKFIAPACNNCNLKLKVPTFVPVFLHNLSGYDSHLFVKELGCTTLSINLIPDNEEKYITFSKDVGSIKLRFLDSFRFMPSSLASLVNNLNHDQLNITKEYFDDTELELVSRKGVYPYDYMDSWNKFKETQLPPKANSSTVLNKHI